MTFLPKHEELGSSKSKLADLRIVLWDKVCASRRQASIADQPVEKRFSDLLGNRSFVRSLLTKK